MFYCLLTQKMGQIYGGKDDNYDCDDEAVHYFFLFCALFFGFKIWKEQFDWTIGNFFQKS